MSEYKWAKLWCDSFEGDTFQNWMSRGDHDLVVLFLLLVAKCRSMGDGEGNLSIPTRRICSIMHTNYRKLRRNLDQFFAETSGSVSGKHSSENIEIFFHNWAIFQENRGGKRRAKAEQKIAGERRQMMEERIAAAECENLVTIQAANSDVAAPTFRSSPIPDNVSSIGRHAWLWDERREQWEDALKVAFGGVLEPAWKHRVQKLASSFEGDLPAFQSFLDRKLEECKDPSTINGFLATVLKDQLGD